MRHLIFGEISADLPDIQEANKRLLHGYFSEPACGVHYQRQNKRNLCNQDDIMYVVVYVTGLCLQLTFFHGRTANGSSTSGLPPICGPQEDFDWPN